MYLRDFRIRRPAYESPQESAAQWLALAHAVAEECRQASPGGEPFDRPNFMGRIAKAVQRYGAGPKCIGSRGHEVPDFLHSRWQDMAIFRVSEDPSGSGMTERMRFFEKCVDTVFEDFYPADCTPPEALVHVTCTGYVSPSGAQKIIASRWEGKNVPVAHAYHMGCYAAFPASRIAAGMLTTSRRRGQAPSRCDIVHTELCTLHLNPSDHRPEQLVVQSLFADGHIRYSCSSESDGSGGLKVLALREEIIPGTPSAMTWMPADFGMRMTLSREVPGLIAGAIESFIERLLEDGASEAVQRSALYFAIHPGGPRIIDALEEVLGLEPWQTRHSRETLFRYGNMSSATLPHVWHAMIGDDSVPPGDSIVSLAFGPGLTVYGSISRKL